MRQEIRFIFVVVFSSLYLTAFSQVSFSCHYREYCDWIEYSKSFGNCEGYDEPSLFVMNEDETMFTHTIETLKSTYYINDSEYDEEKDVWTYNVVSDVGNEYLYVFDPKNKEIRAMYVKDDQPVMIAFHVKAIF